MLRHLETCTIAGLLLAVSSSCPLRASTAYAYSADNVTVSMSGGTQFNLQTSIAVNRSSMSNFGTDRDSGATDPMQTFVGPTLTQPPENSFGPFGAQGPGYSRADTQILGTSVDDMAGKNVAEAYITFPGNASDFALDKFTFGYSASGNTPITITINANPNMIVTTTGDGSAEAAMAFAVNIYDHTTHALLLSWFPDGNPVGDTMLNAGSVSHVADPFNLNGEINCSGNCSNSYMPGMSQWTLSYKGAAGEQYDITAGWYEDVNVAIPEPASLGLAGGALILIGLALRRTRR
jgi:hypothetical protein